ncbi:peptidoglycan recognition protein [Streptomyces sp. MS06]|uniref:peptidoglycan recognition protein family protein n=1 Tax=Streptomyces sp. MS06 TaxID=3385974 RepID=UPI0039A2D2F7
MSRIEGMRRLLASSIGATCAAALALPLTQPAAATPAPAARTSPAAGAAAIAGRAAAASGGVAGGTQSLPLEPLARDRSLGPAAEQGLPRRRVRRFSLVGVVWDDPDAALHGTVQVRARATATGAWSGWQDVEPDNADHGADPGSAERASGRVRGGTAPLWVGDSDGVQVRVRAEGGTGGTGGTGGDAPSRLPSGLRVELVDPGRAAPADGTGRAEGTDRAAGADRAGAAPAGPVGRDTPDQVAGQPEAVPGAVPAALGSRARAASAANTELAGVALGATEIPALDRQQTERELLALPGTGLTEQQRAKPYIGPRPGIVTRRGWGADEKLRESKFRYTNTVKAAFVHHTVTGNAYSCSQAPAVIRSIYRYHVKSLGWRDIGYNFLVDKCGKIYEGRAGGVAKPVMGAHTYGFNTDSMGVAVLGTFTSAKPSSAAVKAIAQLTAWKLGLYGRNPSAKTYLKSGGGNLYKKGKEVRLNVISGHRDGYATECPGRYLYGKLDSTRSTAARYQGR